LVAVRGGTLTHAVGRSGRRHRLGVCAEQLCGAGVSIEQRHISAPVRGIFRGTTGFVGECVRGPVNRLVFCSSYQRFIDVFGERDYGINGGALKGQVWWALQQKAFGKFYVMRAAAAAATFAMQPIPMPLRNATEIEPAIIEFARNSNSGLVILSDPFVVTHRELVMGLAARHRLPAIYPFRYIARAGGLVSYGVDTGDSHRRVATYVDRILRGAKPADLPVDRVIADGAYYSIDRTEALSRAGVTPVIPPPAHAVVHGGEDTRWHDEIVKYIQDKGIYAFHKKYGYGLRSRVEAQISRIKRCIGATLLTQKIASQESEGVIIANIINLWNAFGKPVCVKNA